MSKLVRWFLAGLRRIRTTDHLAAQLSTSFGGAR